jgi:hypothetical protein
VKSVPEIPRLDLLRLLKRRVKLVLHPSIVPKQRPKVGVGPPLEGVPEPQDPVGLEGAETEETKGIGQARILATIVLLRILPPAGVEVGEGPLDLEWVKVAFFGRDFKPSPKVLISIALESTSPSGDSLVDLPRVNPRREWELETL